MSIIKHVLEEEHDRLVELAENYRKNQRPAKGFHFKENTVSERVSLPSFPGFREGAFCVYW
jgi:hypothetical protein